MSETEPEKSRIIKNSLIKNSSVLTMLTQYFPEHQSKRFGTMEFERLVAESKASVGEAIQESNATIGFNVEALNSLADKFIKHKRFHVHVEKKWFYLVLGVAFSTKNQANWSLFEEELDQLKNSFIGDDSYISVDEKTLKNMDNVTDIAKKIGFQLANYQSLEDYQTPFSDFVETMISIDLL